MPNNFILDFNDKTVDLKDARKDPVDYFNRKYINETTIKNKIRFYGYFQDYCIWNHGVFEKDECEKYVQEYIERLFYKGKKLSTIETYLRPVLYYHDLLWSDVVIPGKNNHATLPFC